MDNFKGWLINSKNLKPRSATDVISRIKRCKTILNSNDLIEKSISAIEEKSEFVSLPPTVKSQLRRSINLYMEFNSENSKK